MADRRVRVGNALDLLPQLRQEAPFDLIFIDADKIGYVKYLDWALQLSRPGGIIVADNCIPMGTMPRFPSPAARRRSRNTIDAWLPIRTSFRWRYQLTIVNWMAFAFR